MRVLITGGAGFIGSHLADAYLDRGDNVSILDDLSTGSIDNIRHLKNHPRFHYTLDSVHHQAVVAELVDQCDVIFHLAAAVGVKLIVESPVRTIETNVHGTEVVLAQANKKKKNVLIASTSEVYGLSNQVPFREDGNLVMGATTKGAGAMPARRPSTNSSRWPTGARRSSRPSSCGSSTRSVRGRPASMAW